MGVVRERVHRLLHRLRDRAVEEHGGLEVLELLRGGEAAVEDQVRHLQVGGGLGELLDWVPAVAEDALRRCGGKQRRGVSARARWRGGRLPRVEVAAGCNSVRPAAAG